MHFNKKIKSLKNTNITDSGVVGSFAINFSFIMLNKCNVFYPPEGLWSTLTGWWCNEGCLPSSAAPPWHDPPRPPADGKTLLGWTPEGENNVFILKAGCQIVCARRIYGIISIYWSILSIALHNIGFDDLFILTTIDFKIDKFDKIVQMSTGGDVKTPLLSFKLLSWTIIFFIQ